MNNIFELINRKNVLSHEMVDIFRRISEFRNQNADYSFMLEEVRKTKKGLNDVTSEILTSYAPNLTNGEIDLIKSSFGEGLNYRIFLHDTKIEIGYIEYRGYHYDISLGDIGYSISKCHRGNNYAYKALCLLSNLLSENGIEDFWITAKSDNIASIKTIEKLDGICLGTRDEIYKYRCSTGKVAKKVLS